MTRRISRAKQTIQRQRRPVSRCPTARSAAARLGAVLHVLYLIFNEGYAAPRALTCSAATVGRGDPADPAAAPAAARRRRGRRAARADAADRRAPAGPHRRRRVSWSRWPSRTARCGTPTSSPRASPWSPRRCRVGRRAVPAAGGDRGTARRGAAAPRRPTGPRSSPCTSVLLRISDNPVVALNHAVAVAMAGARMPGSRCLPSLGDTHRRGSPAARRTRASSGSMAGDHERAARGVRGRGPGSPPACPSSAICGPGPPGWSTEGDADVRFRRLASTSEVTVPPGAGTPEEISCVLITCWPGQSSPARCSVAVSLAQAFARDGFDLRRHPISLLSLGGVRLDPGGQLRGLRRAVRRRAPSVCGAV